MERIVVDSNIIVSSFLVQEDFHQRAQIYINGLERGDYIFHLPMLVVVEVMAAISRQAPRDRRLFWQEPGKVLQTGNGMAR